MVDCSFGGSWVGVWSLNLEKRDEMLGFSGEQTRIDDSSQVSTDHFLICASGLPLFGGWGGANEGLCCPDKLSLGEVPDDDDEANK